MEELTNELIRIKNVWLVGDYPTTALDTHASMIGVANMWSPQQYFSKGKEQGHSKEILNKSIKQIESFLCQNHDLPILLSLNHLAVRTNVSYKYLREVITRNSIDYYRSFSIRKRSGGRRYIYIPAPILMLVQRWINIHILQKVDTHSASFAFSKNDSIVKCASRHTGAKWLIKMDIKGFFESISEIQVYRVFKSLGYQKLVAFELARICTIEMHTKEITRKNLKIWQVKKYHYPIHSYNSASGILGYLPQGSPTSPMLSNLVMREIDESIKKLAQSFELTYTRYSDDLAFSTREKNFSRKKAKLFIEEISKILKGSGFQPNRKKTVIVPPGSRKIVLGLLVDGNLPKLRREYKNKIRQHLYYARGYDEIQQHVSHRKFETYFGFRNHLEGLINFAYSVEPDYGEKVKKEFDAIKKYFP